jgi:hypothetical protein
VAEGLVSAEAAAVVVEMFEPVAPV